MEIINKYAILDESWDALWFNVINTHEHVYIYTHTLLVWFIYMALKIIQSFQMLF